MFRNSARHNSLNRQEHGGKQVRTRLHGQEISSETYAIAETDLLLEGEGGAAANRIATFALENNLAKQIGAADSLCGASNQTERDCGVRVLHRCTRPKTSCWVRTSKTTSGRHRAIMESRASCWEVQVRES